MIERLRGSAGTRVVPRRGAVRGLLGALKRGESVGMMIDQHMQDRSAVEVSFFRRSASTTSAIAALALRTGAPIIPVFALPIPRGRYRLVYEAPVDPPAPDDPDPVRTYTQRCTDVLETYVRRHPHLCSGCTAAGARRPSPGRDRARRGWDRLRPPMSDPAIRWFQRA